MRTETVIADIGLGLIAGYVGTKVMEMVSMKLYERESEEARRQEDAVRPGPPYEIAAQKTANLVGVELSEPQVKQAGMVFHYGLGMNWGRCIHS